jgi:hypothetical protein
MKTNTNHSDCLHPATKTARAKCRAARKARATETATKIAALVASYYDNSADADEIIFGLGAIDSALIEGYYDNTKDVEEIIAAVRH